MWGKAKFGTAVLLAFVAGSTASFFLLPIWAIPVIEAARKGSRSDWLGFSGAIVASLITATVTGITIVYFARQIRLQVYTREEDRIERQLPELRNALRFLSEGRAFFDNFEASPITDHLIAAAHFIEAGEPSASPDEIRGIIRILKNLLEKAESLSKAKSGLLIVQHKIAPTVVFPIETLPPNNAEVLAAAKATYETEVTLFRSALKMTYRLCGLYDARIQRLEARLKTLRQQINGFFPQDLRD